MSMQRVASPAAAFVAPPKRAALAHIPGDEGWPVIGRTLAVLADPKGEVERMAARYGHVYRSRVLGETSISVLGPEANELVLFDQTKLFSSTWGWETVLGRLFPRGLMLLDFDEHRLHRRALSVAFKSGPMPSYLGQLNAGIAKGLAQCAARTSVQVLSGHQAADARSRGDVLSGRGAGPGARSGQARLHCDGRRFDRGYPHAPAGYADGPRRARTGVDRRLFQPSDPAAARARRRRSIFPALPRDVGG